MIIKLGWACIPNATCTYVSRHTVIGLKAPKIGLLKGVYHLLAWWPSWSCDQDHLCKFTYPQKNSYLSSISQVLSEILYFNILMRIQYELPQLKGQMSTLTIGTYL